MERHIGLKDEKLVRYLFNLISDIQYKIGLFEYNEDRYTRIKILREINESIILSFNKLMTVMTVADFWSSKDEFNLLKNLIKFTIGSINIDLRKAINAIIASRIDYEFFFGNIKTSFNITTDLIITVIDHPDMFFEIFKLALISFPSINIKLLSAFNQESKSASGIKSIDEAIEISKGGKDKTDDYVTKIVELGRVDEWLETKDLELIWGTSQSNITGITSRLISAGVMIENKVGKKKFYMIDTDKKSRNAINKDLINKGLSDGDTIDKGTNKSINEQE
jgi:hypothetical protein